MHISLIGTISLLLAITDYTVSLVCYTVHWNAYSTFTEKVYRCDDNDDFCASMYDRSAESWYLRAIPLDKKCYSISELRSRINCNMTEFAEGCFMDPRYNTYERSTKPLPVCICKGDYCNTQERIENIWLEQKIYEFHDPEDCDNQMIKEKSATTAGTVTSASTVPLTTAVSSLSTVTSETRAVSANISDSTQPESSASLETQAYTKQESLLVTTAKSELAVTEVEAERTTINSSILRSSFPDVPNDLFTAPGKADDTTIISNYLTTATIITHPNNDTVVAGTNNTTDTVESATSMNDTVTTVTTAATITTVIMTINANTTVNTTEIAN